LQAKSEGGESDVTYLEALAASGLRSIRMAKEVKGLRKIVANDMEPSAVEQMRRNVALNDVQEGEGFEVKCSDAVDLMYAHRKDDKRFHIVDLDPYGAPSIFLDGAVQSVRDGGLLQVTATDLMNLCGNSPDVCFRKYGAVPIKSRFCHEMAIRILLASIALKVREKRRRRRGRGLFFLVLT
jgi:tRNA (guanine26-N2/guanine27-N2)-dimethyltransferase